VTQNAASFLETDRLVLRQPTADDWPVFRDFMMSERSEGLGGPLDEGKAWRSFAAELGHWKIHGFGMWALSRKGDDTALGMVGAWFPADWPETEIGWMIFDPSLEGTGIAHEAAQAAVHHAWTVLKWDTIVSYISKLNTRSIALAERLGAVLDPNATQPGAYTPCLVYRHPRHEAQA